MAAEMGAIKTIMKILKGFISPPIPNKPLPVPVVLAGGPLKPGLSAIDIASEIIKRKKDAGISIGPLPSGADNLDLMMETIRAQVLIEALIRDARVQIAIPPGTNVTASGGNAGGPIIVNGITTAPASGFGVIS
tara:strand:+ start:6853 stop:7254 length:402 start_codon:yes stop_codon:yes gene_type:complete